ncbi:uncharacterized protein LOC129002688 isoform X2 [Macrosteles quadrilineatus]|uniref:uncharacterized protein LOC129002688 isoform X2 n=1 Tax=Macrosteles quadrilineatus TaxID=74068 RepID=UPI0023E1AF93|nr:uncharacterized protein LOC129002688 isoform X2 [Macrosteles quadrilineatus]
MNHVEMLGHNITEPSDDIPWYNDGGPCYSLKTALDIFTKDLYQTDQGVRILLDNFYANVAQLKRSPPLIASRKPFIVIEGMQRRLRYIVTRKVARYLKGMEVYNPPPGYLELRSWFNHSSSLRRAYFALCVYIAANNVKMTLPYRAAVMSGYWLDQATFALAKKYRPGLPPDDSTDWKWPEDLLKPDLIFYLTNKEEIDPTMTQYFPTRKPDPLKEIIGQIFRKWEDPKLIFIQNSTRYREIVAEMIPHINNMLYNWRIQTES